MKKKSFGSCISGKEEINKLPTILSSKLMKSFGEKHIVCAKLQVCLLIEYWNWIIIGIDDITVVICRMTCLSGNRGVYLKVSDQIK